MLTANCAWCLDRLHCTVIYLFYLILDILHSTALYLLFFFVSIHAISKLLFLCRDTGMLENVCMCRRN